MSDGTLTRKQRRADVQQAYLHVRTAVVEMCRASALLDSRSSASPGEPAAAEFYEANRAINQLEELSKKLEWAKR